MQKKSVKIIGNSVVFLLIFNWAFLQPAARAAIVDVTITADSNFSPATVTITSGDQIRWTNQSASEEEPASDPHPTHENYTALNVGPVSSDGSVTSASLTQIGTWGYHNHACGNSCAGTITISAASSQQASAVSGGGSSGIVSHRPTISIASLERSLNNIKISWEADDKNDLGSASEKEKFGLGAAPVSIYYVRFGQKIDHQPLRGDHILIAKNLPKAGSYEWDTTSAPVGAGYRVVVHAEDNYHDIGGDYSEEFQIVQNTIAPPIKTSSEMKIEELKAQILALQKEIKKLLERQMPKIHDIIITEDKFIPRIIEIESGDMIRFVNQSPAPEEPTSMPHTYSLPEGEERKPDYPELEDPRGESSSENGEEYAILSGGSRTTPPLTRAGWWGFHNHSAGSFWRGLVIIRNQATGKPTREYLTSLIPKENLRKGARGEEVRKLQEFLSFNSVIYPQGLITGYFGPLTEEAVEEFQEYYAVLEPGLIEDEENFGAFEEKTRNYIKNLFSFN